MSRTDKDRPGWVKTWQDGHYIDHDHRFGECVEETFEYDRAVSGRGWVSHKHHWRGCKKRVERVFYCTKREPYTYVNSSWGYGELTGRTRYRADQECWIERCRCDVPRGRRHSSRWVASSWDRIACPTWGRVQCEGHTEVKRDASIPCTCDDWPERPTCDAYPAGDQDYFRYFSGGVPSWYVTQYYHRPERARERRLRDLAREYNAYGNLADDDFVNRQARSSARWTWW